MPYLFAATFILFLSGFVYVIYRRLIKPSGLRKSWQMFWFSVTLLLFTLMAGSLFLSSHVNPETSTLLFVNYGYYIMSFGIITVMLTLGRDMVLLCLRLGRSLFASLLRLCKTKAKTDVILDVEAAQADAQYEANRAGVEGELKGLSRRQFVMFTSSAVIVAAALPATSLASYQARKCRVVKEIDINFKDLPAHLEGLRIVHLSDIHVGHTLGEEELAQIVAETNALNGDIVVITGDIVDGTPTAVGPWFAPLRDLTPRYGVFYVTGNHEWFWDGSAWERVIAQHGVEVLHNTHQRLTVNGGPLLIAGVPDPLSHRQTGVFSDPKVALEGTHAQDFKIMLAHQPKSVLPSFEAGADLVLLGHTHGGQFWPGNFVVDRIYQFARGLYYVDGKAAFVSCGTGYWGPPLRFGFPPEICVLNLRSA